MASKAKCSARSALGDSWVVNIDHHDEATASSKREDPQIAESKAPSPFSENRRSTGHSLTFSEPELIMPSIYGGEVEGSPWSTPSRKPSQRPSADTLRPGSKHPRRQTPMASEAKSKQKDMSPPDEALSSLTPLFDSIGNFGRGVFPQINPLMTVLSAFVLLIALSQLARGLDRRMLCTVPGSSLLKVPACQAGSIGTASSSATELDFPQLMKVQGRFEDLLLTSAKESQLPSDMENTELALSHLSTKLYLSDLEYTNEIGLEMSGFAEEAQIARAGVEKLILQVDRATDRVLAEAIWTRNRLRERQVEDSEGSAIASFFKNTIPFVYAALTGASTDQKGMYGELLRTISHAVESLLSETLSLAAALRNFDDRLDVLQTIAEREILPSARNKDTLMVDLLILLADISTQQQNNLMFQQLHLIMRHRERAWDLVTNAILQLGGMRAEVEALNQQRTGSAIIVEGRAILDRVEALTLGVQGLRASKKEAHNLMDLAARSNFGSGDE